MKRIALLVACIALLAGSTGCCCMSRPYMGGGCNPCGAGYAPGGCPGGACGAATAPGGYYGGYQGAYATPYGAPITATLPPDYVVQ